MSVIHKKGEVSDFRFMSYIGDQFLLAKFKSQKSQHFFLFHTRNDRGFVVRNVVEKEIFELDFVVNLDRFYIVFSEKLLSVDSFFLKVFLDFMLDFRSVDVGKKGVSEIFVKIFSNFFFFSTVDFFGFFFTFFLFFFLDFFCYLS